MVAPLACLRTESGDVVPIPPPLLRQDQSRQSRPGGVLIGVLIEPGPAIGADAAPSTGEERLPEQVPLDVESIEPETVRLRIDPAQAHGREGERQMRCKSCALILYNV